MTLLADQFAEDVAVSPGSAAQVQNMHAPQELRDHQPTTVIPRYIQKQTQSLNIIYKHNCNT